MVMIDKVIDWFLWRNYNPEWFLSGCVHLGDEGWVIMV